MISAKEDYRNHIAAEARTQKRESEAKKLAGGDRDAFHAERHRIFSEELDALRTGSASEAPAAKPAKAAKK